MVVPQAGYNQVLIRRIVPDVVPVQVDRQCTAARVIVPDNRGVTTQGPEAKCGVVSQAPHKTLVDDWVECLKRDTDDSLAQQYKPALESGLPIRAILKTVFPPDSPLAGNIPAQRNFDLVHRLVEQLNVTEVTFLSGIGHSNFFAAHSGLPVEYGKTNYDDGE